MTREEFEIKIQNEISEHFTFVPVKVKRTQSKVFGIYSLQYMNYEISKYTIENGEVFTNINNDELLKLMKNIDTDIQFSKEAGTFDSINEKVSVKKSNDRDKKIRKYSKNFKKIAKGIEKFSKEVDKASNHGKKRKRIK